MEVIVAIIVLVVIANALSSKTTCDVCGHEISKRAHVCPRCGDPR